MPSPLPRTSKFFRGEGTRRWNLASLWKARYKSQGLKPKGPHSVQLPQLPREGSKVAQRAEATCLGSYSYLQRASTHQLVFSPITPGRLCPGHFTGQNFLSAFPSCHQKDLTGWPKTRWAEARRPLPPARRPLQPAQLPTPAPSACLSQHLWPLLRLRGAAQAR